MNTETFIVKEIIDRNIKSWFRLNRIVLILKMQGEVRLRIKNMESEFVQAAMLHFQSRVNFEELADYILEMEPCYLYNCKAGDYTVVKSESEDFKAGDSITVTTCYTYTAVVIHNIYLNAEIPDVKLKKC